MEGEKGVDRKATSRQFFPNVSFVGSSLFL